MNPVIELDNLSVRFGKLEALKGLSGAFSGRSIGLLGPNGAGKTTLMKVLYGLYSPDAGKILLDGKAQHFRSPTDAIAAGLGMVHQHFMLFPSLTVAENVVFGHEPCKRGLIDRDAATQQVKELAETFRLEIDGQARVADLPVGLRQRVEILKTLYRQAKVLILDEPTASLDPKTSRQIMRLICELCAERGLAAIINIHDVALAQMFVQRVIGLTAGEIQFDGAPDALTPDVLTRIYGEKDWQATIEKVEEEDEESGVPA